MKVTNIRMKLLDNGTPKYVAVASVTLDNAIVLGGVRLAKREDGNMYLMMPAVRRNNGSFHETFHPIDSKVRDMMTQAVCEHYEKVLADPALEKQRVGLGIQDAALNITDVNIYMLQGSTGRVKAIASVTLDDGFVLKSIRVVEREDDTILAMPRFRQVAREEGAEPRWVETYHPITAEVRKTLTDTVLLAYEKEKIQAQT